LPVGFRILATSNVRKKVALALCLFAGCVLVAPSAGRARQKRHPAAGKHGAALSKTALVAQKRVIELKRARLNRCLWATKKQQYVAGRALAESRTQLREARHDLRIADARLSQARLELDQANRDLRACQKRLSDHLAALSQRLRVMQARRHAQPFAVAVGVSGLSDFADRMYIMQRLARQDLDLLDEIKRETERLARYRAAVKRQELHVSILQADAAEKHEQVSRETAHYQHWANQLAQERAAYERALAELERNSRQIEAMIQRLQRSPAGRTRFMQPWRGSFMRPVAGPIVSGFGYRVHPIYKVRAFHYGIDIAAPTGSPIHAAGSGYVLHSGWLGGYGNCIIIDHGGGVSTVYGHCSRLMVKAGQNVRRGHVIAAVGSTGLATGPHLHFEIRRNGKPVPP